MPGPQICVQSIGIPPWDILRASSDLQVRKNTALAFMVKHAYELVVEKQPIFETESESWML
jgi:hypothetical protein